MRQIFTGYIGGLTLRRAAEEAGLKRSHSSVKKILQNKRYLGDDFYPVIIDQETFDAAEAELKRREEEAGWNKEPVGNSVSRVPLKRFQVKKINRVFRDPYQQAEYVYGLIESED